MTHTPSFQLSRRSLYGFQTATNDLHMEAPSECISVPHDHLPLLRMAIVSLEG